MLASVTKWVECIRLVSTVIHPDMEAALTRSLYVNIFLTLMFLAALKNQVTLLTSPINNYTI